MPLTFTQAWSYLVVWPLCDLQIPRSHGIVLPTRGVKNVKIFWPNSNFAVRTAGAGCQTCLFQSWSKKLGDDEKSRYYIIRRTEKLKTKNSTFNIWENPIKSGWNMKLNSSIILMYIFCWGRKHRRAGPIRLAGCWLAH